MDRMKRKQFAVLAAARLQQTLQQTHPLQDAAVTEAQAQLWFVRLTILRFLEANHYLPRLFSKRDGSVRKVTPRVLDRVCRELSALAGFRELFSAPLPSLTETLLQGEDSLLQGLVTDLPDAQWQGHPELIGWLYQYYRTEEKERTFADLRKRIKIPSERIPAATQMFTPAWIVQYMTQNALGRAWLLRQPKAELPEHWQYYLEESPQHPGVMRTLQRLRKPMQQGDVTSLTFLDPCMGTGHILTYAFDLFMQLYQAEGYTPEWAAIHILECNLYGLDIDAVAASLAAVILRLKARQYHPAALELELSHHLRHFSGLFWKHPSGEVCDAAPYGSLLQPDMVLTGEGAAEMTALLSNRYDVVVTNPPYMTSSSMQPALRDFVRQYYPEGKADLYTAFMERCGSFTKPTGFFAMLTQHTWMFLSTYAPLRRNMAEYTLCSLVHLGARAFSVVDVGTIVRTCAFVCMGSVVPHYRTTYLHAVDAVDKEAAFFEPERRYVCELGRFSSIPKQPMCYWISDAMCRVLDAPKLSSSCKICQGMTTSDNHRFLRYWYEVPKDRIAFGCTSSQDAVQSGRKWFPYNKGGKVRKWYGNNLYVVNYENNGEEMRAFHKALNRLHAGGRIKNAEMYFRPAVTWPFITEISRFGVRYQPAGFLFDVSGSSLFPQAEDCFYLMGLLSSGVVLELLQMYNPTMNVQVEDVGNLPVLWDESVRPDVEQLVQENIALARADWDAFEESWDFTLHPLLRYRTSRLSEAFRCWQAENAAAIQKMLANEIALDQMFSRIYGQTSSRVLTEADITLHRADEVREVESLLSFFVGCLFGRYHIDGFAALQRPILPLQKGVEKDAAAYLEDFLAAACGRETVAENLRYIAQVLQLEGEPLEALRWYFRGTFYKKHRADYHQCPIYWMADSGRQCGFRALVYLHGMDANTQTQLLDAVRKQTAYETTAPMLPAKRRLLLAELERYGSRLADFPAFCPDPDAGVRASLPRYKGIFRK